MVYSFLQQNGMDFTHNGAPKSTAFLHTVSPTLSGSRTRDGTDGISLHPAVPYLRYGDVLSPLLCKCENVQNELVVAADDLAS